MLFEVSTEEVDALLLSMKERTEERQQEREAAGGFHVSGLLRSIMEEGGFTPPRRQADDDPSLRFEMGYIWEDMLGEHFFATGELVSIGTMVVDGIACTPDDFDPNTWEINEYKATWKSYERHPLQEEWYWLNQVKAYCHVMGTNKAKLKVLYVNGNYKPPAPEIIIYRLTFKPYEIEQTWNMVLRHKEELIERGVTYV